MKMQPTRLVIRNFSPFDRFIVYCLKIIGLAPFSVGTPTSVINSRHARIETFRFSKFGLAYNLLLASLYPVFIVLSMQYWSPDSFLMKSFLMLAIMKFRFVFRTFSVIVITSYWAFRQRNAVRIMNEIFEVGCEIAGLWRQPSNKRSLIFLTVHAIINAFVWIAFFGTSIVLHGASYNFSISILNLRLVLVVYWFTVEYFFVVGRIARYLETLNENLSNLEGLRDSYVSHSLYVNEFLQAFSTRTQSSQLAALRSLISIRSKLSELAQDVEDFFSFPILLCCALNFSAFVFEVYDFILRLMSSNNDLSLSRTLDIMAWILIDIYPLISLSANVTRTEKQAKLTAQIVHKLLAKPLGLEIKAELEKFSLYLIHEDFRFTAYGCFPLNSTFLYSMVAATTTYLVILLQFRSSV